MEVELKITRSILSRLIVLGSIFLLNIGILTLGSRLEENAGVSYGGLFVLAFLFNSTVLLPSPILTIVGAMSLSFPPMWVGLVAGIGSTLGELVSYTAGASGRELVDGHVGKRLHNWIERGGGATIFLAAFIPGPVFDFVGIAAGALRFPLGRFVFFCGMGKILKMILFAYLGERLFSTLLEFIK